MFSEEEVRVAQAFASHAALGIKNAELFSASTNVARHTVVCEATVRVGATPEMLGIQVEYRGKGFDPDVALATRASSGLSGMVERARSLGGMLPPRAEGCSSPLRRVSPARRSASGFRSALGPRRPIAPTRCASSACAPRQT